MKKFKITVPGFTLEIEAKSKKDALEQFWFDYDRAQEDPDWGNPIIQDLKK